MCRVFRKSCVETKPSPIPEEQEQEQEQERSPEEDPEESIKPDLVNVD